MLQEFLHSHPYSRKNVPFELKFLQYTRTNLLHIAWTTAGKDLTSYKLLIIRTYRQFNGRVWFAYDRAFGEPSTQQLLNLLTGRQ